MELNPPTKDHLVLFEECPCCKHTSHQAKPLFEVKLLSEICSVLRCPVCSLLYKAYRPTQVGLAQIYAESYVHFNSNKPQIDLAEFCSSKQKLKRCLNVLGKKFQPNQIKLLDIGCGSGKFVEIARQLGYLAEGIDPYLPKHLENHYLHKASPATLPENSYDIVILLNVAEHLDQPEKLFTEIYHTLKPRGVLLLTCPYGNSLARYFYQENWGHLSLDEHLLFWTPKALTLLLRRLGFNEKVSYRIAGSPFPYGRIKESPNVLTTKTYSDRIIKETVNEARKEMKTWQSELWELGRNLQRQEKTADLVRSLVHFTHTGDYLEYAIGIKK